MTAEQELLLWQVRVLAQQNPDLIGATGEYRFHPDRAWRIDVAIPRYRVGVELHGGVFAQERGAHSRGARQVKDWEKVNEAQLAGWILLQVLPEAVKRGTVVGLVERAVRLQKSREAQEV